MKIEYLKGPDSLFALRLKISNGKQGTVIFDFTGHTLKRYRDLKKKYSKKEFLKVAGLDDILIRNKGFGVSIIRLENKRGLYSCDRVNYIDWPTPFGILEGVI